jgi:hypothetical protein
MANIKRDMSQLRVFTLGWLYILEGIFRTGLIFVQGVVMIFSLGMVFPDWMIRYELWRLNIQDKNPL